MSSPLTRIGTCLCLALAAGAPADINSDLTKAALQAAVPEAGMAESAAHTQVPGGGGAEIQEEFASLIQPMLGNATNETCTDPFPVDIFNETIRQQGGYSKLALVCIEGTGLGIIGGDRLYMGQPITAGIKAFTLGGLGFWALADYVNVMLNAVTQDEGQMWSFAPQTWTLQDGKPAFLHFWTDCNLKYARLAALGFMVVGAVVAYKAAKKCLTTVFDFFKNGASKAGEAAAGLL
ncbi:hypothetical protein EMIHUDRAFT_439733 [Emiliania huxleyi CCMP1516]|uniref:TM2 domain-containing protein n=2 Tax=Emiliania huxleyi TaxID=2903 RepID=A0A0D3KWJ7_EMIH1|nr:hypothetical protein EMIHUDRAFT_439733 [Emiliania huxleyi CCMP1516]EOD40132.1 hypothetical protein EMIHUDRAFT_439733 [Emiliania huxleyi CCMP1516]|eukprot:XP_005792561.1 hypothetical protein EMIHUDRAFT_439733 [Emiliania huxleyi CCMP1516]